MWRSPFTTTTMLPRFPQELFDYIMDCARYDENTLESYSTVYKRWSVWSRSHLFERLLLCNPPPHLKQWCENIPPTTDGPPKYMEYIYVQSGVTPLILKPQSLDPYLAHFSALTRVTGLTLDGHRGKIKCSNIFRV